MQQNSNYDIGILNKMGKILTLISLIKLPIISVPLCFCYGSSAFKAVFSLINTYIYINTYIQSLNTGRSATDRQFFDGYSFNILQYELLRSERTLTAPKRDPAPP
jgi:hypothetical protein